MKKVISLILIACSPVFSHPLDDLSGDEIQKVVKIVRGSKRFTDAIRFPTLLTKEPNKQDYLKGKDTSRRALVTVFEKQLNRFHEVVVNLNTSTIESQKTLKGAQPPVLLEEYERVNTIVRSHPQWQAAMKKRGIENFDDVFVDAWASGLRNRIEEKSVLRLMRGLSYYKGGNFFSKNPAMDVRQ